MEHGTWLFTYKHIVLLSAAPRCDAILLFMRSSLVMRQEILLLLSQVANSTFGLA